MYVDEFRDYRPYCPRHTDDTQCQECGEDLSIETSYYINDNERTYLLKCDTCNVHYLVHSRTFDPRRIYKRFNSSK